MEKADELQDPEYSERETAAVRHQEQVMSASRGEEGAIGVGEERVPQQKPGDWLSMLSHTPVPWL